VQHIALRAIHAELAQLVALQPWEGCARVGRVEDPLQIGAGEVVEVGEAGVELAL
jgi:hypothetical protein